MKNEVFYGNNYSTCFAANLAVWARKWKPSSSTMVVLFELLANMRYYNYVLVSQAKLSTKLEFDQGTVSKALSFLENSEILEYVPETRLPIFIKSKPKVQRRWCRLSIDIFWRGAASEIDRAPKNYKMKFRERDSEPEECKSLEDALNKIDNFLEIKE